LKYFHIIYDSVADLVFASCLHTVSSNFIYKNIYHHKMAANQLHEIWNIEYSVLTELHIEHKNKYYTKIGRN